MHNDFDINNPVIQEQRKLLRRKVQFFLWDKEYNFILNDNVSSILNKIRTTQSISYQVLWYDIIQNTVL